MKRFFAIATMLLFVVTAFVACDKNETSCASDFSTSQLSTQNAMDRFLYPNMPHKDTFMVSDDIALEFLVEAMEFSVDNHLLLDVCYDVKWEWFEYVYFREDSPRAQLLIADMQQAKVCGTYNKDPEKVAKWAMERAKEGYHVVITYDKETGLYYGTAYTDEEWEWYKKKGLL